MADQIAADLASRTVVPEAGGGLAQATPSTSSATQASASSADFSTALTSWRQVQLGSLTTHLSELSPSLIATQTEALISRKRLAEQTREFRKLSDEAKVEAFKPLLKAYQAEIDSLTNRAKRAENAFLAVAGRLADVPDPYPFLELLLDQTASLQDLDALRTQAAQLQQDKAALQLKLSTHATLEADRAKLSERVASLQASLEARVAERTSTLESSLAARWEERVSNHVAREADLTRALELAQSQLKELRAAHARATEREVESSDTTDRIGELEMSLANEDLRRAKERVQAVERRNEQLRGEMEALKTSSGEEERAREWQRQIDERDVEVRRVEAALEAQEEKAKRAIEDERRKLEEKDRTLAERQREAEALRAKLARMQDYDEIKRELQIVKYVEFAVEEEEDEEAEQNDAQAATDKATSAAKPLEALLVSKNRKLQDEVTTMRVQQAEMSTASAATARELTSLKAEVTRLRELNTRLEDDLVNVKQGGAAALGGGKEMTAEEALAEMDRMGQVAGSSQKVSGAAAAAANGRSSPAPFNVEGVSTTAGSATASGAATPSSTAAAGASRESSILPIITSQRDRFRARNAELEEELRKQFETLSELRSEIKTLQTDNLNLYEKVRYLQAYSSNPTASAGASGQLRPAAAALRTGGASSDRPYAAASARTTSVAGRSVGIDVGAGGEEDDKYRDRYEASMNPFEAFRGREQTRAVASLNPIERILHRLLQFVLADRRLRLLFVVYAACLHLLVFAMLWEVA